VLQVGTRPNKGLAEAIAACAGTAWRLRVVGEMEDGQRHLAQERGVPVDELGDLDDDGLAAAYAGADVLVFASSREGFGMPVVEAQASGRPVVTSNREPLPWVAGPGGALLVDPSDPVAIRAALAKVLADAVTRDALVAAGLANVERFAPARVASQYAAIYDEIAQRR
jgi:glycosyltransferase involved in cell wall biosynthesis